MGQCWSGDFKVTPRVSNVEQWADVLHLPVSPLEPSSTAFWCASNKCVQSTNTSAQPLPVHDKHATWSCNLVDAYGVTAGTLPHSISDVIDLRCCASRCASSTCDALDRASGFGSHVLECGACPTAMTSGCGPSVAGWDGTNHITNRAENDGIPPWAMSVCRAQIIHNATNAAHVRYFLAQQAAERFLLDSAEATLCTGIPTDGSTEADDAYHRRLHSLLAPYRMSTRMHISFAFLAKMTCVPTAYADRHRAMMNLNLKDQPLYMRGYFTSLGGSRSSSFGKTPSNGHIGADAAGFMPGTQIEWERLEKPWSRHAPAYVAERSPNGRTCHCTYPCALFWSHCGVRVPRAAGTSLRMQRAFPPPTTTGASYQSSTTSRSTSRSHGTCGTTRETCSLRARAFVPARRRRVATSLRRGGWSRMPSAFGIRITWPLRRTSPRMRPRAPGWRRHCPASPKRSTGLWTPRSRTSTITLCGTWNQSVSSASAPRRG